jgi:hypothetical protein
LNVSLTKIVYDTGKVLSNKNYSCVNLSIIRFGITGSQQHTQRNTADVEIIKIVTSVLNFDGLSYYIAFNFKCFPDFVCLKILSFQVSTVS